MINDSTSDSRAVSPSSRPGQSPPTRGPCPESSSRTGSSALGRYARHDAGASLRDARDQLAFLRSRFIHPSWAEFREHGRLVMVSVVDELPQGMSAVYTFYDPAQERRSLGVYSVMALVQECAQRELPWLYLGYWIQECHKMSYKDRFQPLEAYVGGRWQALAGASDPA